MLSNELVNRIRRFNAMHALLAVGVLGLAARFVIISKSIGSNDMITWSYFAQQIHQIGVGRMYDVNSQFNHPPLMGHLAHGWFDLATRSGVRYEVLFKLPLVVADALSAWLVFRSWRRRSPRYASVAFALFCWNPVSMFVTAYHGNTDSLCASLSFLAVVLMDAEFAFLAGLALAASINVKLIPVIMAPVLLSCARSPREALRFVFGLSLGALPYAPYVLTHWEGFRAHVLGWRSYPNEWGITGLLYEIGANRHFTTLSRAVSQFWVDLGAFIVLAFPVILAAINRFKRGLYSARELGALCYAGFVVLAPGWGIQYSVYPMALLFATNLTRGTAYGAVAGAYVVVVYVSLWTGAYPYFSDFRGGQPLGGKLVGYLAWLVCARSVFDLFRKESVPPSLRATTHVGVSEEADLHPRTNAARSGETLPQTPAAR